MIDTGHDMTNLLLPLIIPNCFLTGPGCHELSTFDERDVPSIDDNVLHLRASGLPHDLAQTGPASAVLLHVLLDDIFFL